MAASRVADGTTRLLGSSPAGASSSSCRSCRWGLPPLRFFGRKRPEPIPVDKPLDAKQLKRHREGRIRATEPGHFERLARDRRLVMECLSHYNLMHPNMEYEPAPGEVTRYIRSHDGLSWTHGNFVARRKRSGCFPFLPAPRTLFFFELIRTSDFHGVVTCIPLDEQVTEGYSILGFPIWRGTRRNGRSECICKTCYCRCDFPDKPLPCGHNEAERICEMCYHRFGVLHPFPGEFAYGYREYLYRCYY
ncbi:hypothetical protein QOZ80_3BG0253230 [Eleusine coracana subsp. coracana]|nr:hypothetical protein QOZ80_3BG0253230 [Eleusine coracana subsp. coracana]